jgi:hypothetical protein
MNNRFYQTQAVHMALPGGQTLLGICRSMLERAMNGVVLEYTVTGFLSPDGYRPLNHQADQHPSPKPYGETAPVEPFGCHSRTYLTGFEEGQGCFKLYNLCELPAVIMQTKQEFWWALKSDGTVHDAS